jgi:hypothetical protein
MPNFFRAFREFKAVHAALVAHGNSEFAQQKRDKAVVERYSAYLDLSNWPASPSLKGMTVQARAELQEWGDDFTVRLSAFHHSTQTLEADRITSLRAALYALGVHAGQDFLKSVGRLDRRLAQVINNAGSVRQNMLDGLRYLSVFEENSHFAAGFYLVTKLKRTALLTELAMYSAHRKSKTQQLLEA